MDPTVFSEATATFLGRQEDIMLSKVRDILTYQPGVAEMEKESLIPTQYCTRHPSSDPVNDFLLILLMEINDNIRTTKYIWVTINFSWLCLDNTDLRFCSRLNVYVTPKFIRWSLTSSALVSGEDCGSGDEIAPLWKRPRAAPSPLQPREDTGER